MERSEKFVGIILTIVAIVIAIGGIITVWAVANAQKQSAPKFTITFKADEQIVKTIETSGNEVLSLPTAPNKVGFTFEGCIIVF